MSDILSFVGEHQLLTWCLAWIIWPITSMVSTIAVAPFRYPYLAYKRRLRSHDIQARGWPTAPFMDADGDIVMPKNGDAA